MIVGKIENGLERGFVKHRLNCLFMTDPLFLASRPKYKDQVIRKHLARLQGDFTIYKMADGVEGPGHVAKYSTNRGVFGKSVEKAKIKPYS